MDVKDKVVVVTGGARGIGRALCHRFARAGASCLVVADLVEEDALRTAVEIGGFARKCDVRQESSLRDLIEDVETTYGPIDLFCSNAGVLINDPEPQNPASATDDVWLKCWQVHVMAHVHAARILGPRMAERGHGHFLQTISAAGLLTQMGSGSYSATKHAAVAFAESLAIAYRNRGVGVSILCPQGVATEMIRDIMHTPAVADGLLTPEEVADCAFEGLRAGQFLILPHSQVTEYLRRKTSDPDRWIAGMSRLHNL